MRWRKKYLPKGASGLLNFGVKGGAKAGEKFIEAAQFMSHLANIGDAKTLIIHPASTTHRQMSDEEQLKAGVTPDMVRMSVGIESLDDILWDIDQALTMRRPRRRDMISYQFLEHGKPLQKVLHDTPKPTGTEVLVRITRSGVCHSDLHIWDGYFDWGGGKRFYVKERGCMPPFTLGHEPFGIVEAVWARKRKRREDRPEAHRLSLDRLRQVRGVQVRPGQLLRVRLALPRRQPPRRLREPRAGAATRSTWSIRPASTTPSPRRSPARASPPTAPPPSCPSSGPRTGSR